MFKETNSAYTPSHITLLSLFSIMPFVWVYGHIGMTAVAFILSIICGVSYVRTFGINTFIKHLKKYNTVILSLGTIIIWAIMTSPWALNPEYAFVKSMQLLLAIIIIPIILSLHQLSHPIQKSIRFIFAISFMIAIVLLYLENTDCVFVQAKTGIPDTCGILKNAFGAHSYNNNFFPFVLFSPILGIIALQNQHTRFKKIIAYMAIQMVIIFVITSANNAATILTYFIIQSVFLSAMILPNFTRTSMIGLALLLAIGIIPISQYIVNNHADFLRNQYVSAVSEKMRIEIWNYSGTKISENPITGVGLKNGRFIPDSDAIFISTQSLPKEQLWKIGIYNHPHNMFVELLLDLGVVGFSLAIFVIIQLSQAIKNSPIHLQPYYLSIMGASFTLYSIGLSLWRVWWLMVIVIAIALLPILIKPPQDKK